MKGIIANINIIDLGYSLISDSSGDFVFGIETYINYNDKKLIKSLEYRGDDSLQESFYYIVDNPESIINQDFLNSYILRKVSNNEFIFRGNSKELRQYFRKERIKNILNKK